MDFKKTIITMFLCGFAAAGLSAQTAWKLPAKHQNIADKQIEMNLAQSNPFMAEAMKTVRANSPFADMLAAPSATPSAIVNPMESRMVDYAARFLGTRYRLGASGPKAFDCSGFTSYVYKNFGITLSRTSRSQFMQGEKVAVNNLRPGDLLFFGSRSAGRGNVGHVAMVVSVDPKNGTCRFIHASVKHGVTYQNFPDNGYYSRNFMGARRILGTSLDVTAQASNR